MNALKWISLSMLVLGFCSVPVQAQQLCGISASINDFFLIGNAPAANVHVGDQIYYIVSIEVPLANFPVIEGEPTLTLPDGTVIDLDDDLALSNGDFEIYDSRDYTGGIYTVDAADRNGDDEIQAHAAVTATCVEEPPDEATGTGEATAVIVTAPCTDVDILAIPPGPVEPGALIDLVVQETNCGEDPIYNVSVVVNDGGSDIATLLGSNAIESMTNDDILEVGETMTWDATTDASLDDIVVSAPTTFTATGTGLDPLDNEITIPGYPEEQDSVTVDVECPEPCINIGKFVDCGTSKVGDTVTYTICIENCGLLPLTELIVTDPHLGAGPLADFPSTLNPEDGLICVDFPYIIQESDEPGPIENQATVQAIQVCGEEITPIIELSNIVTVDLVHPCLEVDVECISEGPVVPGGIADFQVTLINCGDVDLLVDVTDTLGDCDATDLYVAAGGSSSCQTSVPVPEDFAEAEICNEVEAHWTIYEGGDCLPNEGTVVEEGCCQITGSTFCSVTQGYWGNAGGKKCGGIETPELIDALLGIGGPVIIGLPGHSITLGSSQCIIDLLPAGGPVAILPAGDFGCPVDGLDPIPSSILKESKGKGKSKPSPFNNVLIGQVVALSLNVRLGALPCLNNGEPDGLLGLFVIPEGPFCTVPAGSEYGCPKQVEIDSAFAGMTVAELLELANQALGGADISPYNLSQINGAVTGINEGFDGCRTVVPCPEEEICDNGCDDDFDGLVDIEDPDCQD